MDDDAPTAATADDLTDDLSHGPTDELTGEPVRSLADSVRVPVRDPDGLVAAVPYLVGHRPSRSLVVVGVAAGRVRFAARVDHRPREPRATTVATWQHLRDVLRRNACRDALVVVYTDQEPDRLLAGHEATLLQVVPTGTQLDGSVGLNLLDLVVVGPSRFRSLVCPDVGCCPPEGRPTAPLAHHPVATALVVEGRDPAPDRASVEPVPWPAPRQARTAAQRACRSALGSSRGCRAAASGRWPGRTAVLEEWLRVLPHAPSPALAGRLAAAWRLDPGLRDACLTALTGAGAAGARDLLAGRRTGEVLDEATRGSTPGSLQAAGDVLRSMAALLRPPQRAVVLAGHAWLAWSAGDGTRALVLAERALTDDPETRLAALVLHCLQHGLGPRSADPPGEGAGSAA